MGNAASSSPPPPPPLGAGPSSSFSRASSPGPRPSSSSTQPSLPGARPSSSPPSPAALPEELVEDILLRFPPDKPASLLRAALVCKPWGRLISGPRFRRRYRELHRTPPVLGYLCNTGYAGSRFVPTTAFSPPGTGRFDLEVLDTNHGRVLGRMYVPEEEDNVLVVWDPIADEQWVLPFPPQFALGWAAAVVCAGTATGSCNHLDCNRGPFLVVFVGLDPSEMFVCTYSSDVDAWSEPISSQQLDDCGNLVDRTVLVGNAIYFGFDCENKYLKFNLESQEMSLIQLPDKCDYFGRHVLTTTEEGLLGLLTIFDSELAMWSRNGPPDVDAGWTKIRVIDLKTALPLDANGFFSSPKVAGFANGHGILFMLVKCDVYTIDLKTHKVEFYKGVGEIVIFPYISFYTPELEVARAGQGPSDGGSSA